MSVHMNHLKDAMERLFLHSSSAFVLVVDLKTYKKAVIMIIKKHHSMLKLGSLENSVLVLNRRHCLNTPV